MTGSQRTSADGAMPVAEHHAAEDDNAIAKSRRYEPVAATGRMRRGKYTFGARFVAPTRLLRAAENRLGEEVPRQ